LKDDKYKIIKDKTLVINVDIFLGCHLGWTDRKSQYSTIHRV